MTKVRIENSKWEYINEVEVDHTKPLLKQLEAHDVEIANACNIGMCGACLCMSESNPDLLNKSLRGEPAFPLWDEEIMTCIWGVVDTPETVVLRTMD